MKNRFEGTEGRRRLVDSLRDQRAVAHDQTIAEKIADVANLRDHKLGDILMVQDTDSNDVAFLLAGRVDILVNGQRVASRTAGEHVGEMSAIDPKAKRSASVRASEETVAAWVTEPQITEIAQQHPVLWRSFARLLADRLRERGALVRAPNAQPRLFIGSSVEGLETGRIIQKGLDHDSIVVTIWNNGVFGPSGVSANDLLAEAARSDFALFVLRGDDTTQSRGTNLLAPRDNVIFELGVFMGVLGRERTLLLRPRGTNIKIPSDLLGITALDYDASGAANDLESALGPTCHEIRRLVKRLGPR